MNAFLSALQAKAPNPIQTPPAPKPKLELRIELVSSRNRIDLFFSEIPPEDTRRFMKQKGFRFNPDSKAWYHQDNEEHRDFCRKMFGATLDAYLTPYQPHYDGCDANDNECTACTDNVGEHTCEPLPDVPPTQPLIELCETPVTPEFAKFREQTNQLIEQLKIEPADLMLVAIDALHREIFGGVKN
jgi:hypothetical protein